MTAVAALLSLGDARNESGLAEVALRPMVAGDRAFVLSTWIRSYAERVRGIVRRDVYLAHEPALVERLLASSRALVACSASHEATIHGWCVVAPSSRVLHYAYTPPELRRLGLARELIRAAFGTYPTRLETSHRWPWASPRFVFVPYHAGVAP